MESNHHLMMNTTTGRTLLKSPQKTCLQIFTYSTNVDQNSVENDNHNNNYYYNNSNKNSTDDDDYFLESLFIICM